MKLEQNPDELTGVTLLINLLVRFPEILTIHYNLAEAHFKLSFMLNMRPEPERYAAFQRKFSECMKAYYKMLQIDPVCSKIYQKPINDWTLLQVLFHKKNASLEEINMINTLILNEFEEEIIADVRVEEFPGGHKEFFDRSPGEDLVECLLPERKKHKKENLFAFREAGKVYVFDKQCPQ